MRTTVKEGFFPTNFLIKTTRLRRLAFRCRKKCKNIPDQVFQASFSVAQRIIYIVGTVLFFDVFLGNQWAKFVCVRLKLVF